MNPGRHFTYSQCGRPRRLRRSRPANWWTAPLFGRCETPSTHPSSECTGAQGIERDGNPGHAGCATLLATRHKGDTHYHCSDACRRQVRFLMRDVLSGTHRAAPIPPPLVGRVGWRFIVKRGNLLNLLSSARWSHGSKSHNPCAGYAAHGRSGKPLARPALKNAKLHAIT